MITNKISNFFAAGMLVLMFVLLFSSAWNDSAIMDELAHIPAGYSYLTQKDMRLNPEHPPLIKDLAAAPLLFLNLNFPVNQKFWTEDINGQWTAGSVFLYESGNDPDKILRFARFPVILLALLFGFLLFKWVRGMYGNKTALLTLFLFVFSPTFLAHSRYVTTDLGAAFGFFIGIAAFVKFLEKERDSSLLSQQFTGGAISTFSQEARLPVKSSKKYLIIAGIAFGIAELLKFSLVLLVPLYIIYGLLWAFVVNFSKTGAFETSFKSRFKNFLKHWIKILGKTILIFIIGGAIIYLVYLFHIWNYPVERQIHDTASTLNSFSIKSLANLVAQMAGISVFRPIAQYLLGVLMVVQRAVGGNTAYFMGEVSAAGSYYYFPVAYGLKENLAFHILTLIAFIVGLKLILKSKNRGLYSFFEWIRENFFLSAGIIFTALYLTQSITSPLNIGVRHILPTFPFIYLLVSRRIVLWTNNADFDFRAKGFFGSLKLAYHRYIKTIPRILIVFICVLWIFLSALVSFPYYLSYYNELVGGTKNGYKYITDSNYDWGQDLKRLNFFAEKNNIQEIYLDYFGGGSPRYYFGEKFKPWNAEKGLLPQNSYFAVSATFQQESIAKPVRGFVKNEEKTYFWLKNKEPIARAGTSIFIYKF